MIVNAKFLTVRRPHGSLQMCFFNPLPCVVYCAHGEEGALRGMVGFSRRKNPLLGSVLVTFGA